jgi:hypothetical protein
LVIMPRSDNCPKMPARGTIRVSRSCIAVMARIIRMAVSGSFLYGQIGIYPMLGGGRILRPGQAGHSNGGHGRAGPAMSLWVAPTPFGKIRGLPAGSGQGSTPARSGPGNGVRVRLRSVKA